MFLVTVTVTVTQMAMKSGSILHDSDTRVRGTYPKKPGGFFG